MIFENLITKKGEYILKVQDFCFERNGDGNDDGKFVE